MKRRKRCFKNIFHILKVVTSRITKILRGSGSKTRDRLLRPTLAILRATLIQKMPEPIGKDGLQLLIRRSQRNSKIWSKIPRLSFHFCHGQKRWKKILLWHQISPRLRSLPLLPTVALLESTFQIMMTSEKLMASKMCFWVIRWQVTHLVLPNLPQKSNQNSSVTTPCAHIKFTWHATSSSATEQESSFTEAKTAPAQLSPTPSQKTPSNHAMKKEKCGRPSSARPQRAMKSAEQTFVDSSCAHLRRSIHYLDLKIMKSIYFFGSMS